MCERPAGELSVRYVPAVHTYSSKAAQRVCLIHGLIDVPITNMRIDEQSPGRAPHTPYWMAIANTKHAHVHKMHNDAEPEARAGAYLPSPSRPGLARPMLEHRSKHRTLAALPNRHHQHRRLRTKYLSDE